jgi:hypothetical protein
MIIRSSLPTSAYAANAPTVAVASPLRGPWTVNEHTQRTVSNPVSRLHIFIDQPVKVNFPFWEHWYQESCRYKGRRTSLLPPVWTPSGHLLYRSRMSRMLQSTNVPWQTGIRTPSITLPIKDKIQDGLTHVSSHDVSPKLLAFKP